jgi:hypothetical protein
LRFSSRTGSALIQPCRVHQAAADLMASRETFQVDGDRLTHRVKPGREPFRVDVRRASLPHSVTIQRRTGP